jgi:hemerythrin-like domain-containing protein
MQLQRDLRCLSGGESEARQTLGRDLNEYIEARRRHMTFEEQFIFPLAGRTLRAAGLATDRGR